MNDVQMFVIIMSPFVGFKCPQIKREYLAMPGL